MNKARLGFIKFVGTLVGLIILGRLVDVQVLQADRFQAQALDQYQRELVRQSQRGTIYDRAYRKLAVDLEYYSYGIAPDQIESKKEIARAFANTLNIPVKDTYERVASDGFVWLARKVKLEIAEEIDEFAIPHLSKTPQYGRFYPAGETAAQVVGFSDVDNQGLSGLELQYDNTLRGTDGRTVITSDARGRHVPGPNVVVQDPVDGNDLVLTIDLMYQAICEEELQNAVKKHNAKGGRVILLDPTTSEILSLNCYPGFDPNNPGDYSAEHRKNRVITDLYEPGSTFKLITLAAALQEGVVTPSSTFFCENGVIQVARHNIRDDHVYGDLTARQIFELSSNIGAYKIAKELGPNKLYEYARDFGIGTKTGCGLVGEVPGTLRHPKEWSKLSLPSISFGYEIMVTAMHIANAYAAVANGGMLMQPYIVKAELDAEGRPVKTYGPKPIRRVVDQAVADTMLSFMEGVVLRGTAKTAQVDGWRVGGKTGTAKKAENGRYGRTYVASFVGAYPIDQPRFLCYMVIDSPKGAYYGSAVAAPPVKRILQRIGTLPGSGELIVWDSRKTGQSRAPNTRTPDLVGLRNRETTQSLRNISATVLQNGDGPLVVSQSPTAGEPLTASDTLRVEYGHQLPDATEKVKMPKLTGLSMREAVIRLGQQKLRADITGRGKVLRQSPRAGSLVPAGAHCRITGSKSVAG
jgi:cell division protein FtsI/penicillin-binding protein 2